MVLKPIPIIPPGIHFTLISKEQAKINCPEVCLDSTNCSKQGQLKEIHKHIFQFKTVFGKKFNTSNLNTTLSVQYEEQLISAFN